ncbi:MAG: hypothetical protein KC466_07345 [Myxococcales bacterium]|nr:hypothetical protein [Myxococcales bacterium]
MLAVVGAPGCADRERAAIETTLEARADALRALDLKRYAPLVSEHYNADGRNREAVLQRFASFATLKPPIVYEVLSRDVQRTDRRAVVVESYVLAFETTKGHQEVRDTAEFVLEKEGSVWRFVGGL